MAEYLDDAKAIESTTVGVYRTAATVKGGRRFSFSSLVVVGDRNGRLGYGYGKANQVPPSIEKAQKEARRRMRAYPLLGRTIPHEVTGTFGACRVRLIPASPGTGVIAGASVRAPLEMLGVQDCLTKSYGSNNNKNLVKAVVNGLAQLRTRETVESLRGVTVEKSALETAIENSMRTPASEPEVQEETVDSPKADEATGDPADTGTDTAVSLVEDPAPDSPSPDGDMETETVKEASPPAEEDGVPKTNVSDGDGAGDASEPVEQDAGEAPAGEGTTKPGDDDEGGNDTGN